MIDSMAGRMAESLKRANPERTASVAVMRFSLILLLNALATVALCLAIGWATGRLAETAVVLAGFVVLRFFSGGFHLKSSDACVVFSTAIISALPHLSVPDWTMRLTIASAALAALLAPTKVENQIQVSEGHKPWFKLISVVIVCANFAIGSESLAKAFFVQALLLIPMRRR